MKPKRLPLVGRIVYDSPWAIQPAMLSEIVRIYESHVNGEDLDIPAIEAALGRPLEREFRETPYDLENGVATIPIEGTIAKRMDTFSQISGGASVEGIASAFRAAMADDQVDSVVLKVDSPGGEIDGIFELADLIYQARTIKPVVALAYGTMASAAYLIGSAASSVYASDIATAVGSIGVAAVHRDHSDSRTTEVYKGEYKRILAGPLTEKGRLHLEDRVNYFYGLLVDAIARNRGVTSEEVLKKMSTEVNDLFVGDQAVEAGLVDGILTLDRLVSKLSGEPADEEPGSPYAFPRESKSVLMSSDVTIETSLSHNSTIADREPDWGPYLEANRSKLPDNAFADPENRAYPHHWVKNGVVDKETGRFKTGDMYLHRGGWKAAWSAAHGARSGKKASEAVINHLESHRSAVEGADGNHKKEATMSRKKMQLSPRGRPMLMAAPRTARAATKPAQRQKWKARGSSICPLSSSETRRRPSSGQLRSRA